LISVKEGHEADVEQFLRWKFSKGEIVRIARKQKEDLDLVRSYLRYAFLKLALQANHLLGKKKLYLQIVFRNVADLLTGKPDRALRIEKQGTQLLAQCGGSLCPSSNAMPTGATTRTSTLSCNHRFFILFSSTNLFCTARRNQLPRTMPVPRRNATRTLWITLSMFANTTSRTAFVSPLTVVSGSLLFII